MKVSDKPNWKYPLASSSKNIVGTLISSQKYLRSIFNIHFGQKENKSLRKRKLFDLEYLKDALLKLIVLLVCYTVSTHNFRSHNHSIL